MNRTLLMFFFLSSSVCGSTSAVAQDFSSLLEKAKSTVTAKDHSLELVSKRQERDNEVVTNGILQGG